MKISRSTYEALSVGRFLSIDLETTGLDPSKDEIIELGMVRMEMGEVSERYNQIFNPTVPVPRIITQLTGIRTEDCEDQPTLGEKFPDIVKFFKDDWIVAHNADFDFGFLQKAWERFMPDSVPMPSSKILDTLELSRLFLHWLPNHRLETVAEYLKIPSKPTHRALNDAEATALIFNELIHLILSLDHRTIGLILRIIDGASDGLCTFFERVARFIEKYGSTRKVVSRQSSPNILGKENRYSSEPEIHKIQANEIDAFFEPHGFLSEVLPGYELRKPQQEMARLVGRIFNEEIFLVAEAGTGVGKSLAYLIPITLWVTQSEKSRVIVSTHTKTLQDQLFSKELPLLIKMFERPFLAVLLKGRANYLCLRRWEHLLSQMEERFSPRQRRRLLPLVCWVAQTQTGDIEENAGFGRRRNGEIWSQLNCEGAHCLGHQCEYESNCFFQRVRRASRSADIIVVNHSLLFSDVAAHYTVLGDYDTLVIDEAHQIERVASDCIGKTLHPWLFLEISRRLYRQEPQEKGILVTLQNSIRKHGKDKTGRDELASILDRLKELSQDLWRSALSFFQKMMGIFSSKILQQGQYRKHRIRESQEICGLISVEIETLENVLDRLISILSRCLSLFVEIETNVPLILEGVGKELESILDQVMYLRELVAYFCRGEYDENVVWCELIQRQEQKEIYLYSVPLNIADILVESLYTRLRRCVMTSATLSVGGSFDYILGRFGVNRLEKDRVVSQEFGSPFDFSEQALLLVPTYLSNPREDSFSKDVAAFLERVLLIHSRGTMVLFTSHKLLREVYHTIQPVLEKNDIRLLGQGLDGSRISLLTLFQKDEKSVLLGTNSFWEGVDVPGSALELLVITKIPFAVPTDPLVEARMERVHAETGNGFLNYAVPEAIVMFRQGFGRLIRSREDSGVVLMLDHRIVQTRYGTLFLESLPVEANICHENSTLMEILEEWFTHRIID